jgi:hypothetical protein
VARAPVIDGRRVDSLVQELRRYAPHYTPELSVADDQSAGAAMFRIFAQVAEAILVRLARAPQKHFVAFLDRLGITLLPARPASAPITFRLASGFTDEVNVPAGTRVTAQGTEGDIPFETTGELTAIPATLTAAYGVDPDADAIYPPPPGFLDQTIRTPTELTYQVLLFTPAGATRIQLDHATELQPASMVRIDCRQKAVVAKVDANIVTLEAPLEREAAGGAIVTPIRDFEVFNGINRQEHALYFGDPDLFAVKEQAYITIAITLFPIPGVTLSPLRLAWQFWTKPATDSDSADSEERWEPLVVDQDATEGLTKSGTITLIKDPLGIKEREVGGRRSLWIRALLLDPLPGGAGALPEIDTIKVSVQSTPPGKPETEEVGIEAEQGFHNATPLDLKVQPAIGFLPFGTEPRQFDQFYVASKEAFSKRGATVKLNFTLDLQTLASPTAVALTKGLRAYSIGLRRRLYELDIPTETWATLGSPGDLPQGAGFQPLEDSSPSAIASSSNDVYVFVNTEDTAAADPTKKATKLWVCFRPASGSTSQWIDLGAPPDVQLKLNPVAILLPGASPAFARVFAVSTDGKLYSRDVTNAPAAAASWQPLGQPSAESQIASSPFVATSGPEIFVFVTGADSVVYVWRSSTSGWAPLTPFDTAFKARSRPFAQLFASSGDVLAKVFVVGETAQDDRKLFECETTDPISGTFVWTDLGRPPGKPMTGKDADSLAPVGFVEHPEAIAATDEGRHIFLRDANDLLYEFLDTPASSDWVPRTRTGDPPLRDAPFTLIEASSIGTIVNIVAASARNSIVTWRFEIVAGTLPAPPQGQAVLLDRDKANGDDNHYVSATQQLHLTDGTTTEYHLVVAYDGRRHVARLATPLTVIPDSTFACTFGTEDAGSADDDTDTLTVFHPTAPRAGNERTIFLDVAGTIVPVRFYSRLTGVLSIATIDQPAGGEAFKLYTELVGDRTEFLATVDTTSVPELSWEYWNGTGWLSLEVSDLTRNLLTSGKVTFKVPPSIQSTEVVGQENFWIRARLVGGDYGRETFKVVNNIVVSEKSTLRPPKVSSLRIIYIGAPVTPAVCLTSNNLDYVDQTAAALLGGAHFRPFEPLERYPDRSVTLFLGFDKPFKTGPIRIFIDAAEREYDESAPPEVDWQFRRDRRWKPLDAEDGSTALTRQGILMLSASEELTREARFGQSLFWIRGSLRTDLGGSIPSRPLLRAILVNTVEALQGEMITGEIIGSSDGEPNQAHSMQHANVLEREDVRVQEALSAEEQEQIRRQAGKDGKDAIVTREDLEGLWVRWRETQALFDAGPEDRCYLLDRAAGLVQFGDGVHGKIPPAGVDNIRAFSYRTGGGAAGNVAAGKIDALASAVAGAESVFNPIAAGGGSDAATTDAMLEIGPRRISHRDRAVAAVDFEDLAREASRQVAKVRCLATTNLTREGVGKPDPCDPGQRHRARSAPGYVSLIVVPDSPDPRPCPSLELRRTVKDFLLARVPGTLAAGDRIVIRPPDYVEVSVKADIVVTTLEQAAAAESKARAALDQLLHPLRGGPDGTGWEFGRPMWKSDVFSRLERIDEIDRVENLEFLFRNTSDRDRVAIGPNELMASGTHRLSIRKG